VSAGAKMPLSPRSAGLLQEYATLLLSCGLAMATADETPSECHRQKLARRSRGTRVLHKELNTEDEHVGA
jgi:hypothetical protein